MCRTRNGRTVAGVTVSRCRLASGRRGSGRQQCPEDESPVRSASQSNRALLLASRYSKRPTCTLKADRRVPAKCWVVLLLEDRQQRPRYLRSENGSWLHNDLRDRI